MKSFLYICLLGFWQPTLAPKPTTMLHEFLREVASQQLSDTELAEKYMCTSIIKRRDQAGDRTRYLFHLTIEWYRKELQEQHIDPNDIVITPFDELAIKPVVITGNNNQVYEAHYKGKNFCYFLLDGDKITSLNLLHKDAKSNFFLPYCD